MTDATRHTIRSKHVSIWNLAIFNLLISLISSFEKKEFKQRLHRIGFKPKHGLTAAGR